MTDLQTCKGRFNHSDNVSIDIYDLSDNSLIIDGGTCEEIGSTGLFKYKPNIIVTEYKEFAWMMYNGNGLYVDGSFSLDKNFDNVLEAIENVHDDINIISNNGPHKWTYTITDSETGLPISGVEVWISTDVLGANVIRMGITNSNGQIDFYFENDDVGNTIYLWRTKDGVIFSDPDIEIID